MPWWMLDEQRRAMEQDRSLSAVVGERGSAGPEEDVGLRRVEVR